MQMMHQASIDFDEKKKYPGFDSMRPFHKEISTLNFTLAMVRETCLNEEEENPQVPEDSEWKSKENKYDTFSDEEMLLVSMTNTSVAIVQARGCSEQEPCSSCGGKGCTFNDVVMASAQSTVSSGED